MKVIKYTLNPDGTIPSYILDGGYLSVKNSNQSPQDWDLIGKAVDNAPGTVFANEAELLGYAQNKNMSFVEPTTLEEIPVENVISNLWDKLSN